MKLLRLRGHATAGRGERRSPWVRAFLRLAVLSPEQELSDGACFGPRALVEREIVGQQQRRGGYPEQANPNNRTPGEASRADEERDADAAGLPPAVSIRLVWGLEITGHWLAGRAAEARRQWGIGRETLRWRAAATNVRSEKQQQQIFGLWFFFVFSFIF